MATDHGLCTFSLFSALCSQLVAFLPVPTPCSFTLLPTMETASLGACPVLKCEAGTGYKEKDPQVNSDEAPVKRTSSVQCAGTTHNWQPVPE
jgi:uncharacterized protein (DUF2126 family)